MEDGRGREAYFPNAGMLEGSNFPLRADIAFLAAVVAAESVVAVDFVGSVVEFADFAGFVVAAEFAAANLTFRGLCSFLLVFHVFHCHLEQK